jgi:UDP-GlcNAc:undecaprenyl-phosphate GlcNAc-1-phosphate transferase
MIFYLLVFLTSFVISLVVIPLLIKLSHRFNIFDRLDLRKIHGRPISRIGGLGIFVSFIITLSIYLRRVEVDVRFSIPVYLIALCLSFALGFIDDLVHIRARYKLIAQIVVAFLAAYSGLLIDQFTLANLFTIKFGYFSYVLTIIWILIYMNAINFIDGMDGLASGVVAIASVFIFIISLIMGNSLISFIALIMLGSVIGFYIFNFPPARIFMGDGGAYFLGFMYSTIALMGVKKSSVAVLFAIPIVLVAIPIVDTIRVVLKRIREKKGVFIADRTHIHHRLLAMGLSTRNILFITYFLTVILGVFSVMIILLPQEYAFIIFILIFLIMFFSYYLIFLFERQIEKVKSENNKKSNM